MNYYNVLFEIDDGIIKEDLVIAKNAGEAIMLTITNPGYFNIDFEIIGVENVIDVIEV